MVIDILNNLIILGDVGFGVTVVWVWVSVMVSSDSLFKLVQHMPLSDINSELRGKQSVTHVQSGSGGVNT